MESQQIYPWQESDYKYLVGLEGNMPHAVILYSGANLGVESLAINWSKYVLCDNKTSGLACGKCNSCILLVDGNHPDFYSVYDEVDEEKKQITVDDVRKVVNFLTVGPHLGQKKIVFIEDGSRLNLNSANALLKILEEPPSFALFIILINNLGNVLPTIKSRAMKYHVTKPDITVAIKYLANSNIENIEFWLKFYDNCPLFETPISGAEMQQIVATLSLPSIDNIYNTTATFDGKKVEFGFILNFLNKWISDLVSRKLGGKLEYFDAYSSEVSRILDKLVLEKAFYLLDQINFFLRWEKHPLNYKLQIENLFFKYQQIFVK